MYPEWKVASSHKHTKNTVLKNVMFRCLYSFSSCLCPYCRGVQHTTFGIWDSKIMLISAWFLGYHVIFGFPCDLCWFLDFSLTYWDTNTIKVKPIFTLFSTHHLFSVIRQPTVAVHQTNFSLCHSVGWLASFCYRKYVSPFSIHLIMWVLSCSWSNSTVTGSISKARHVKLAITYLSVFITCIWMQLSLLC